MFGGLLNLAQPALLALPPENAHELALRGLELGLLPKNRTPDPASLRQRVFGLDFPNPVGVAAGFDKDARVPDAILSLGCGFAEVGTVTPLPQPGNPTPRVFRLIEERAVINRLGFNNGGHAEALRRLKARNSKGGIVGVNIGANKDSDDRAADYVKGLETFNGVASYFTVNISSPNTPGLRDLQAPEALNELIGRVMETRERLVAAGQPKRPVIVKIAPDIAEEDVRAICERLVAHAVDGIAVSNTTITRPIVSVETARQAGGLSGRPLFHRATVMLARVHQATGGKVPLIGIGGIDSGATALAKIEAGASLIQLYTGLIYEGWPLIGRIKAQLADACEEAGAASIGELSGRRAAHWASQPFE
ncbi:MAG: quinone-dependent dihydroorotate dehydrogenase [Alphaproteobacteria bacterium]|nr:quinone-dependent dihydroorotate dehydrogenase [Alphaproteobacteria bacterium]